MRRYLFYSHDGQGLGHARRNLAISRALVALDPKAAVLLVTGVEELAQFGLPSRVELLRLPALRKVQNEEYESRRLPIDSRQTRALRSSLMLTAVKSFRPHVVLADKHPFGANGEFRHALAAAKRLGARAALGLRDILDAPATVRTEWEPHGLPGVIAEHYDEVFIYGQRDVFDAPAAYGFPQELAARTRFLGYVINGPIPLRSNRRNGEQPHVLASVGGGEDGLHLLETFLVAAAGATWRGIAVTGPNCPPAHRARLAARAAKVGVEWHEFVPELQGRLASAGAVVCMGGYNTLGEALVAGAPVVCVPRAAPRQEQLIRAQAFAGLGLLRVILPDALTPDSLRSEVAAALAALAAPCPLDFEGARNAAVRLRDLAESAAARLEPQEELAPA